MTALDTWRKTAFQGAPTRASLYWWFGTYAIDQPRGATGNDHLLWELHYDHATDAWIVCGAVMTVNPAHPFPAVHPFTVEKKRDQARPLQRIVFNIAKNDPLIAYDCILELTATPGADSFDMDAIRIGVVVGATATSQPGWLARLAGAGTPTARMDERLACPGPDGLAGTLVDIACPDCGGFGAKRSYAVPQALLDSGASGYALFSAHTINATVACTACGGSGANYEAWYLAEQPQLCATPLAKGRGLVQARRLPCHGSLKPA